MERAKKYSLMATRKEIEAKTKDRIGDLKARVWDCQNALLASFNGNGEVPELETILTGVSGFLDKERTDVFQEEATNVQIMTQNGQYAYI